jgi:streptomycin 6-kinase
VDFARAKGGERWAAALPATIAALSAEWGITVGARLSGGTSSYVASAVTATGDPAVLKLSVPGVDFAREICTMQAAAGRGYVRVLAADADRDAVLLEPLGGSLDRAGLRPREQLRITAGLLPLAWAVPRAELPYDKAAALAADLPGMWERAGRPCPEPIVAAAMSCAARRSAAFDPDRCVTVHGDAAMANVLRHPAGGWVFVDPDGFVGDPDYDRGVVLRDWCRELLAAADPTALLESYAAVLGGDRDAVLEWAYLERVSTGVYVMSLGADDSPHLGTAALLRAGPPAG